MYNKSHHTHTNSQLLKSKVYFWVKLYKNNEFSDKELNFIFFSVFFFLAQIVFDSFLFAQ